MSVIDPGENGEQRRPARREATPDDTPRTNGAGTSAPSADTPRTGSSVASSAGDHPETPTVRRAPADDRSYRATDTSATTADADGHAYRTSEIPATRADVLDRERDRFGGVKIGSAFFGWLTATGTAVVLVAVLAALGLLVGAATSTDAGAVVDTTVDRAASDPTGTGLVGAVGLLVVALVAYFCGGYVAGRMARFDGLKQGVAVWVWAVVVAVVVAVVGLVAGARGDVLEQVVLPGLPSGAGVSTAGVLLLVAVAAVALVGAVLGGLVGMRFHRRVDRAGLGG